MTRPRLSQTARLLAAWKRIDAAELARWRAFRAAQEERERVYAERRAGRLP